MRPESFFQHFSEALFELDKDGYIRYANPAATELTGFSIADLMDKPLSVLYNRTEDGSKMDYELQVARKKGRLITEGWRERRDHTRFWGQMILAPLQEGPGTWYGYSCLLTDISEKKKIEIDLRKNEERYRLIVDGVQEYSIIMLDPEGHIFTWNDGARLINGYEPHEIIGKHFSIFYLADDIMDDKPAKDLQQAVTEGKYKAEGWRIKKNGSVFWADIVLTPLYDNANRLIGFSKVTRDLTDRKQNEEHLRQSEERYRLFVEQVTDYAIFMIDEKGRIASWNEGARRIKGYEAKEIIGKYFSIFYPEEDIINGKPAHELRVAQEEGKYEEEGWRIRKDGTRFWANVVITPVYTHDSKLVGYSKVTRDLTERKASEQALRDSFEQYRAIAGELKITNGELSYANQELEQFTSIVSHDLQEPVRTVKSFLQLIDLQLSSATPTDLKGYLSKAMLASDRMKELIQNLLQYSQLGKREIKKEVVAVRQLFRDALQNLKTTIDETKTEIKIETGVETVMGDPTQLLQLVQNLLSNAIKFTGPDSPRVRLRCVSEKGHVHMSVSDNGIGIAEEDFEKVFEIFRRLNTRNKYPGTGIGLAICKKIVERHQGRIWPESAPGQGTTFHFTLNEGNKVKP